ncbi:hypothetical protein K505DRAFT_358417 [Melanomma pulvis-pyrius CBS 109.77]|uniref:BTB domain-containing protein n=1 Tax=Melanomma pulvis-pyrius CBS 109.77 TaxID=1314802 RepID=A0A6A6XMU4_9PLEO|nr:hypothetical protein K505DRAFT_358417 [Melanomma pulvis-pyrius CBS 109.77]
MDSLTEATAQLSVVANTKDLTLICGDDVYRLNKKVLMHQSPYFALVCSMGRAETENRLILHQTRQKYVRALFHFFKRGTYHGPVKTARFHTPVWENNCDNPAGEENGMTLELWSEDPAVLEHFPELEDTCFIDGDKAVRACKLITNHELFPKHNDRAFQSIGSFDPNYYRCQLDLLPTPIKLELCTYFSHLGTRSDDYDSNPVFHAYMFDTAVKYMVERMKSPIVQAFREGVEPWKNTSLFPETSFLTAVEIIWAAKFPVEDGKDNELVEALVEVMAENWGWMRHDEDIRMLMMNPEYEQLYYTVAQEAEALCKDWEEKLRS